MTLMEKLKELSATTGRRNGNEDLGHWADREKHENTWVREEALPALIAVAEAAGYLVFAEKRQGFELDLADWARAKDNLKAALANLEG